MKDLFTTQKERNMHEEIYRTTENTDVEYLLSLVQASSELSFQLEKLMLENPNTHISKALSAIIPISLTLKNKLNVIWEEYITDYAKSNLTVFTGEN